MTEQALIAATEKIPAERGPEQKSAPKANNDWFSDVPRSARWPTWWGVIVLCVGIAGFGTWGYTAPIAGAVMANGAFVTTGQNKIVQHLEGGVIRDIKVREGDLVAEGAPLMILDDTAPRAELRRLVLREARLTATQIRLSAEMNEAPALVFPQHMLHLAEDDNDLREALEGQNQAFIARKENLDSQMAVLRDGISALEEHIGGVQIQVKAVHEQLGFIEEELEVKSALLRQGLAKKGEVLALQRARANLRGEIGRLTGDIGDFKERIARTREQIVSVKKAAVKGAVEQLQETRGDLNDLRERIRSAEGILTRMTIAAPVRGIVVKLRYNTPRGVIEPGKSILEIVPNGEDLLIEVSVRPQDIENVKNGQNATIRLTSLNRRVTPTVPGKVVYVSADALPSEKRGPQSPDSYVARVSLDLKAATHIADFKPSAGMPAEVYIETSSRSFFEYLMRPFSDSLARAFREY